MDAEKFQELRNCFNNRRGIYIEKGALIVTVTKIRAHLNSLTPITARITEIPTVGLENTVFHMWMRNQTPPLQWDISTDMPEYYSRNCWGDALAGWILYVDPLLVEAAIEAAASWPEHMNFVERYNAVLDLVQGDGWPD